VLQVLKENGTHEAPEPYLNRVGDAVVDGLQTDPVVGQAFEDPGEILLISRDPIERLDDHDVEAARLRIGQQIEDALAADHGRARLRAVEVFRNDV